MSIVCEFGVGTCECNVQVPLQQDTAIIYEWAALRFQGFKVFVCVCVCRFPSSSAAVRSE